jgi:inner membrane protein
MPSTIVHLAFAALIASALLGAAFDRRALAFVLVVMALPDLDSFVTIAGTPGHRTLLHNIWPAVLATVALSVDLSGERSLLRQRFGDRGVRVAWVTILCFVVAHVGLDLVDGYVNLLWPLHDQFYDLRGTLELSDQRGIVQTFVEGDGFLLFEAKGTTESVYITTGVDPGPSPGEEDPERLFPIFRAGWQVVIFVTGVAVTAAKCTLPEDPAA